MKYMVIINNKKENQTIDLERFREGIQKYTKGKDVISEKEFSLKDSLEIPAKTAFILELL